MVVTFVSESWIKPSLYKNLRYFQIFCRGPKCSCLDPMAIWTGKKRLQRQVIFISCGLGGGGEEECSGHTPSIGKLDARGTGPYHLPPGFWEEWHFRLISSTRPHSNPENGKLWNIHSAIQNLTFTDNKLHFFAERRNFGKRYSWKARFSYDEFQIYSRHPRFLQTPAE